MMNKDLLIVGISGFARSGKDTFCNLLLKKSPRFKRYAFADKLKQDLYNFLMEKCSLDIFNLTDEQKKQVRPLLIAYGCMMRDMGDGLYWVKQLEQQMLQDFQKEDNLGSHQTIPVITDFRFPNEVKYFKERYNLVLAEVRRDEIPDPPQEEKINQPLVREYVSYKAHWPTVGDDNINVLNEYIEQFTRNWCNIN